MDKSQLILEQAAQDLRDVIKEELAAGHFAEVARVARLADSVFRLAIAEGPSGRLNGPAISTEPEDDGRDEERTAVGRSARGNGSRKRTNNAQLEYPRFEREGSRLVKVGWSKRDARPYEHKTPREVIKLVHRALLNEAKNNGDFVIDDVFPVKGDGGVEIPSYQVYLVIAWFRDLGLVERRGKVGYRANRKLLTEPRVEAAWASLAGSRRG